MAEHKSLAGALAAFQAVVPKMSKDETAKVKSEKANYTYGYAGLDQFVEIVEPVLGQHGLAVTSRTTYADGAFMLEVALVHESGERETAYWPLPDPRRAGPQDLGSAMTYGRRYLGWGLTGTFPGGIDDDGKQAQATHRESWDDARPTRQAAARPVSAPPAPPADAEPPRAPKTSWTDTEVYDIQAKMGTVSVAQALGAYDWMAGKGLHDRMVSNPGNHAQPAMNATTVIAVKVAAAAQDPQSSVEMIEALKVQASDRGLLKVMVSSDATLEQVIHEARELAAYEATQGSPGSDGNEAN